jgi:hypothetical protein
MVVPAPPVLDVDDDYDDGDDSSVFVAVDPADAVRGGRVARSNTFMPWWLAIPAVVAVACLAFLVWADPGGAIRPVAQDAVAAVGYVFRAFVGAILLVVLLVAALGVAALPLAICIGTVALPVMLSLAGFLSIARWACLAAAALVLAAGGFMLCVGSATVSPWSIDYGAAQAVGVLGACTFWGGLGSAFGCLVAASLSPAKSTSR